ncbi:MAG: adenylate/guanylate cyclase domain-containing protein [Anaerolineae bacterium]
MPTRRDIEKAIVVLEANRTRLSEEVVAYSLAALHKALPVGEVRPQAQANQREPMTALVADLHGFTAMSDRMDAEMVRDTMNALWARLDSVIEAWGGRLDKHTGDGLIALFGEAAGYQDDGQRAVQAALEMQMALSLFNETAVTLSGKPLDLQMRIAIHRGPVYFSQVGMSQAYTAVGQTVDVANQLQHMAPEGKVLISYEVYWRVHDLYQIETPNPVRLPGKGGLLHVYVVNRENPRTFRTVFQDFENGPRLVGRVREL